MPRDEARRIAANVAKVPELPHKSAKASVWHVMPMSVSEAPITMKFDRYGHLFEDVTADREDMAKIEAAVRAA